MKRVRNYASFCNEILACRRTNERGCVLFYFVPLECAGVLMEKPVVLLVIASMSCVGPPLPSAIALPFAIPKRL